MLSWGFLSGYAFCLALTCKVITPGLPIPFLYSSDSPISLLLKKPHLFKYTIPILLNSRAISHFQGNIFYEATQLVTSSLIPSHAHSVLHLQAPFPSTELPGQLS